MFWVCHIIISPLACELTYLLTQESAPPQESALPLRNMGLRIDINLKTYVIITWGAELTSILKPKKYGERNEYQPLNAVDANK